MLVVYQHRHGGEASGVCTSTRPRCGKARLRAPHVTGLGHFHDFPMDPGRPAATADPDLPSAPSSFAAIQTDGKQWNYLKSALPLMLMHCATAERYSLV